MFFFAVRSSQVAVRRSQLASCLAQLLLITQFCK